MTVPKVPFDHSVIQGFEVQGMVYLRSSEYLDSSLMKDKPCTF